MANEVLSLNGVESNFIETLASFNKLEGKDKIKKDFSDHYLQQAFKYLIDVFDHIESVKRADKRLLELPALVESKQKEIDELSFTQNPEFHKKETREKVKVLEKELERLESEVKTFPDDIKNRLLQADLAIKNYVFNTERADLVSRM